MSENCAYAGVSVTWSSQAGGNVKTKTGVILTNLDAGDNGLEVLSFTVGEFKRSAVEFDAYSSIDRYIVKVVADDVVKYYAPRKSVIDQLVLEQLSKKIQPPSEPKESLGDKAAKCKLGQMMPGKSAKYTTVGIKDGVAVGFRWVEVGSRLKFRILTDQVEFDLPSYESNVEGRSGLIDVDAFQTVNGTMMVSPRTTKQVAKVVDLLLEALQTRGYTVGSLDFLAEQSDFLPEGDDLSADTAVGLKFIRGKL